MLQEEAFAIASKQFKTDVVSRKGEITMILILPPDRSIRSRLGLNVELHFTESSRHLKRHSPSN